MYVGGAFCSHFKDLKDSLFSQIIYNVVVMNTSKHSKTSSVMYVNQLAYKITEEVSLCHGFGKFYYFSAPEIVEQNEKFNTPEIGCYKCY